jgi:MFS family permease
MNREQKTNYILSQRDRDALKILIGGMLGLVVAMGIGRFVFTPILPLMQRDLAMSNTVAGWLAGLNYLGYLIGAIVCSLSPKLLLSRMVAISSLLLSLATTLFMGLTVSALWWGVMRFGGGVASAILFIIISAEVTEALVRRGYTHWVGALYGGIGIGIALSGLIVPPLDKIWGWSGTWIRAGALAIVLAVIGIAIGRRRDLVQPITIDTSTQKSGLLNLRMLSVAYFFEGLGYIVTATFIVTIIADTPGLAAFAPYSWVAVGLAAVPSTILWPYVARRIGNKRTLLIAYAFQSVGIFVSMYADSIIEVLFVAVSFGGTFLGIVAMTLAEGNLRLPNDGRRAAAVLTASFGIGQMLGPVLAGILADIQQGFFLPLMLAGICVLIGGLFVAFDRRFASAHERV